MPTNFSRLNKSILRVPCHSDRAKLLIFKLPVDALQFDVLGGRYEKKSNYLKLLVYVADTEDPQILCIAYKSEFTDYEERTALIEWEEPTVWDNSEEVLHATCNPPSGNAFPIIGQTGVVCEVVDKSGNKAECHFQVDVVGT